MRVTSHDSFLLLQTAFGKTFLEALLLGGVQGIQETHQQVFVELRAEQALESEVGVRVKVFLFKCFHTLRGVFV